MILKKPGKTGISDSIVYIYINIYIAFELQSPELEIFQIKTEDAHKT